MQKGRMMQYASVGVQDAPGIRLNVRSNVRLPDSEAGYDGAAYQQQPFLAGRVAAQPRRHVTVPLRGAMVFLCALAVVFGAMILSRVSQKARLNQDRSAMESAIVNTMKENADMAMQVAEARDSARICYAAVQSLGMISSNGVEAVPVLARDTRPATINTAAQGTSPNPALEGNMIGSR